MAYHGVLIPEAIAAMNVDSFNRSAYTSASAMDNGFVFQLATKLATSGSGAEVFVATAPATGSLTDLWMAYSGDEIVVTDARYKGIDPDPRNFFIAATKVFSAFKPQKGDIILATAEVLTGTAELAFAVAANGSYMLNWSAAAQDPGLCFKYLGKKYISLATGAIDSQRVDAYEFQCISI